MRTIKFRRYIPEENRFVYCEDGNNEYLGTFFTVASKIELLTGTKIRKDQFTGLLDKNGKEIYEGDIVLIPDEETIPITDSGEGPREPANHLAGVIFEDGAFKFKVTDSADILRKGNYTWNWLNEETGTGEIEVIGNIYTNPDLLTQ